MTSGFRISARRTYACLREASADCGFIGVELNDLGLQNIRAIAQYRCSVREQHLVAEGQSFSVPREPSILAVSLPGTGSLAFR